MRHDAASSRDRTKEGHMRKVITGARSPCAGWVALGGRLRRDGERNGEERQRSVARRRPTTSTARPATTSCTAWPATTSWSAGRQRPAQRRPRGRQPQLRRGNDKATRRRLRPGEPELRDRAGMSPPAFSIADASVSEGNSGAATLAFAVTLSKAGKKAASVTFATAGRISPRARRLLEREWNAYVQPGRDEQDDHRLGRRRPRVSSWTRR